MIPVVPQTANIAAACAARPPNGVVSGLRGDDLPLARQQPLCFGQGQTQAAEIDEIIGPADLHDVRARPSPSAPIVPNLTIQATHPPSAREQRKQPTGRRTPNFAAVPSEGA